MNTSLMLITELFVGVLYRRLGDVAPQINVW